MKKLFRLLIVGAGSAIAACTNNPAEDAGPTPDAVPETPAASRIVWSPEADTAPTLPADGGKSTFKFAATVSWKVSVSGGENKTSWLTVDRLSGEAGSAALVISVEPNTEESRAASVLIATTDGVASTVVTVSQEGTEPVQDTVSPNPVLPDTSVENVLDKITDPVFKTYCKRFAGEDGILTRSEAEAVEKIVVNNLNVRSLAGIGEFPNLKILHCSGFDFSQFTNSKTGKPYSADRVDLTELDLSGNAKLEYLDCSENAGLTALDLSANPNLVTLVCDDCGLTSLTLPSADAGSKLESLLCSGCKLTALNVANCTSLVTLWCNKNKVKTLNVGACTQLQDLHCSSCGLSALDVSNNPELYALYCDDNSLATLNVSGNARLTLLFCGKNRIEALNVSKTNLPDCSYPVSLDCSDMQVEQFTLTLGSGWSQRKMKLPANTTILYE